jgi:formylglycine-generating enzyme required for sulfatase activity
MAAPSPERFNQLTKLALTRQKRQVQFFTEPLNQNIGIEMMLIPAGVFLMGSPEDELERVNWEGPQHEVCVSAFFMSKYPVTQAQWRVVAGFPQVSRELHPDPSMFKGDNRPVEQVSWYEVVEFCERLSTYTGREYRVPTEAEWEYACRAGTTTPFHFGETITTDLANYLGIDNKGYSDDEGYPHQLSGCYVPGPKGIYRRETTPVDYFGIANAFGLCDMHGNVREWCQDHWHKNYKGAPTDGSAWLTNDEQARRVQRGGSWLDYPRSCRSASRDLGWVFNNDAHPYSGFRVVWSRSFGQN